MEYTSALNLYRQIRDELKPIYMHEADMLSMIIVEEVSGFNRTDILTDHKFQTDPSLESTISRYILQLKRHEPIQYILGKADFYDNVFEVDESTLIPRQETEELVNLVLSFIKNLENPSVIDIGVGSGCIATSIALNNSMAKVEGCDISTAALAVAKRNASSLGANVAFFSADIFNYDAQRRYDVIVSNPPYVRESEKQYMARNVLENEPAKALFVPDDDALRFYHRITDFAVKSLKVDGGLFFEVNEALAEEVAEVLRDCKFNKVVVVKDINGKDRFIYGLQSEQSIRLD